MESMFWLNKTTSVPNPVLHSVFVPSCSQNKEIDCQRRVIYKSKFYQVSSIILAEWPRGLIDTSPFWTPLVISTLIVVPNAQSSPKWLTHSFFNMHSWRHPGRADMLCMLIKMIHKYTTKRIKAIWCHYIKNKNKLTF